MEAQGMMEMDDDLLVLESYYDLEAVKQVEGRKQEIIQSHLKQLEITAGRSEKGEGTTSSDSPFNIFSACKAGVLCRVEYLVEQQDIDVNRKDEFDSIPLFYACLCGHGHIVKYLLDKGAKLDDSSFEGARCYYGALNDEIRKLLRCYQAKPRQSDPLAENWKNVILMNPMVPFADFEMLVQDRPIRVHKFVLLARSEYFKTMLSSERWKGKCRIRFTDVGRVSFEAMRILIEYFYTDSLQVSGKGADWISLLYILRRLKMRSLRERLLDIWRKQSNKGIEQVILKPVGQSNILRNMFQGVFQSLAARSHNLNLLFPDIILVHDNHQFPAHRIVLSSRSPYLLKLFSGYFKESKGGGSCFQVGTQTFLPIHELTLSPGTPVKVFHTVLEFMYTFQVENEMSGSNGTETEKEKQGNFWFQVLQIAEMFLMDDLKMHCFRALSHCVCLGNLWKCISLGMEFKSRRIIDAAVDFIRFNSRRVYASQGFVNLINAPRDLQIAADIRQLLEDEMDELFGNMILLWKKHIE